MVEQSPVQGALGTLRSQTTELWNWSNKEKKKKEIGNPIKYWRTKLYLINPKAVIVLYPQLWLLGFVPTGRFQQQKTSHTTFNSFEYSYVVIQGPSA